MKIEVIIEGGPPKHPKQQTLALEALAKSVTQGPPEAIMALVIAAMHIHRAYALKTDHDDEVAHFGAMIGWALGCVDSWWPEAGEEMPDDVISIANDDQPKGPLQ